MKLLTEPLEPHRLVEARGEVPLEALEDLLVREAALEINWLMSREFVFVCFSEFLYELTAFYRHGLCHVRVPCRVIIHIYTAFYH